MKNPTKEQVQVVIDNLTKAKEMCAVEGLACPVDMEEPHIHSCGSPMCHGGYYALVKGLKDSLEADYEDGAILLAQDLGFEDDTDLGNWADKNEDLWGNEYGFLMFSDEAAFTGSRYSRVEDLQVIIDHWKGVQERLPV